MRHVGTSLFLPFSYLNTYLLPRDDVPSAHTPRTEPFLRNWRASDPRCPAYTGCALRVAAFLFWLWTLTRHHRTADLLYKRLDLPVPPVHLPPAVDSSVLPRYLGLIRCHSGSRHPATPGGTILPSPLSSWPFHTTASVLCSTDDGLYLPLLLVVAHAALPLYCYYRCATLLLPQAFYRLQPSRHAGVSNDEGDGQRRRDDTLPVPFATCWLDHSSYWQKMTHYATRPLTICRSVLRGVMGGKDRRRMVEGVNGINNARMPALQPARITATARHAPHAHARR